jgi:hypothetical protein
LAKDYLGHPVVFLEYDVNADFSSRSSRWWAAYGGNYATYPFVMVDSGNQISNGPVDFYNVYKGMVDASLDRSPQAAIEAYTWRDGDRVGFYVQLKNLADVTLSLSNSAAIHGIVYEDINVGVTNRYVRAAATTSITSLEPGASAIFTFDTAELSGVNWDKLQYVVLVDYIPTGSSGVYDMLQATQAVIVSTPFNVQPNPVWFLIDPLDPPNPTAFLSIQGANIANWSAVESIPWVTITPANGSISTHPVVSIDTALLSQGVQQGIIAFTTDDGYFSKDLTVNVYFGPLDHLYLPFVYR